MKKIATLTTHGADNYGALLQALVCESKKHLIDVTEERV